MKKNDAPQTSMNEIGWLDNRSQICSSYSYTIQRSAEVPLYSSEKENEVALQFNGKWNSLFSVPWYHFAVFTGIEALQHCSHSSRCCCSQVGFYSTKNVYREKNNNVRKLFLYEETWKHVLEGKKKKHNVCSEYITLC